MPVFIWGAIEFMVKTRGLDTSSMGIADLGWLAYLDIQGDLKRGNTMTMRPIVPPQFRMAAEKLKLSPALISGDHVFLTGVTGTGSDGQMPEDPETQIRNVFDKIGLVLRHADLTFGAIVEMTSYHVGIGDHFDLFAETRAEYVQEPYPAWTAVEVAGLRRKGAIVEIRVVASITQDG